MFENLQYNTSIGLVVSYVTENFSSNICTTLLLYVYQTSTFIQLRTSYQPLRMLPSF